MASRLVIERFSGDEERRVSHDGTVDGACPGCAAVPFMIVTPPLEDFEPGEKRAGGRCVVCNDPVGWVYVTERDGSIFGEEEDRNVLELGRARVYGMEVPR
jgi:hypothetical protein